MRRAGCKIFTLMIFVMIFFAASASQSSQSFAALKKLNKANLNKFNIYQLGESEIIINFNGKNLPEPEIFMSENNLNFKFINSENKLINKNYLEAVPLVVNYEIKNLSDDLVINIETKRPMQIYTRYKNTFRLKVEEDNKNITPLKPVKNKLNLANIFPKNEQINFEANNIDLRDVFALFANYINKNIIIDESFPSKTVTLSFNNMPLYDAVRNFMTSNNISYRLLDNNTVVFGSIDGLSRFSGSEKLAKFNIAYADLNEIKERLAKLLNLSGEKIINDSRTRALYIKTNPEKLEQAKNLIQKLDSPGRQVKIYARIFEFSDNYNKELESTLNSVYKHWSFNFTRETGGSIRYLESNPESLINNMLRQVDVTFRNLESKGRGRTLASPSVTALNGHEAKISLTEDYPYIKEHDEAGNTEWGTQTVGPQLLITPSIGRDNLISMKIDISTGDVIEMITGSNGEMMPRTSKRSVTTNLLVHDGEPFIIGGLFHESDAARRSGIPVLSSVPLLGELFKYKYREHNKNQAIILVVPYIINTPDSQIEFEIID